MTTDAARTPTDATALDTEFKRGLGLFDATMVVVGSMIGSGIFIVSADIARLVGSPGVAAGGLAGHRRAHAGGGAVLRRTGGDDAARRWPVRLPARGVLAAVGLPLRVDALPRHPDRHHCRGRRRVCALPRRAVADDCRGPLPDRAHPPEHGLRAVAVDGAARRGRADRAAHLDEHARHRVRPHRPERLHRRQDRRAHRADRRRADAGLECRSGRGQLRRPLDATRPGRRRARPERRDRVRPVRRAVRRADRLALLVRRVEQHHLHRRRGQGPAAQPAAGAGAGHRPGHRRSICWRTSPTW